MRDKGVSVISGSDGPTAVFIAGKGKADLKQRIYKLRYNLRKKKVIKSLKAAPHTMEQQAEQWKLREEAAMNVPVELFDIDMHIYEINYGRCYSRITLEGKYGYIGASSSGTKRYVKKFDKMYKEIYRYYGVAQSDIDNHTERYDDVVRALTAF